MEIDKIYLLKNLRGIIHFDPHLNVTTEWTWLRKKFRYRKLGISQHLLELSGLPVLSMLEILTPTLELSELPPPASDSLALATEYVTPLIILKSASLTPFEPLVLHKVTTADKLPDTELRRNIRLVNYSIIDYCRDIIHADATTRLKIVQDDAKRFWRVQPGTIPLIVWLDLAKLESPPLKLVIPSVIIDL